MDRPEVGTCFFDNRGKQIRFSARDAGSYRPLELGRCPISADADNSLTPTDRGMSGRPPCENIRVIQLCNNMDSNTINHISLITGNLISSKDQVHVAHPTSGQWPSRQPQALP